MKKLTILLLTLSFLLCGCSAGQRLKEPVTFYYIQEHYQYGAAPGVFAPEVREAAGHREDLEYLLALYLIGPSEEGLSAPLPIGTRIFSVEETATDLILRLSDTTDIMSDVDFTRACACLTLTSLELTDVQKVTIQSGARSVTMTRDNLILYDKIPESEEHE